jgi:hypothetical protein
MLVFLSTVRLSKGPTRASTARAVAAYFQSPGLHWLRASPFDVIAGVFAQLLQFANIGFESLARLSQVFELIALDAYPFAETLLGGGDRGSNVGALNILAATGRVGWPVGVRVRRRRRRRG